MLFKLILLVTMNGNVYADVVDYDLTREDCINQMIYVNSKLKNDSIEYICQGEIEY
ncbi:hypothetical protein BS46_gp149 [Acinetobacter phage BS46]|nr:hypothetical protein BS46_gp149 [Acinetobacter phage BS46]